MPTRNKAYRYVELAFLPGSWPKDGWSGWAGFLAAGINVNWDWIQQGLNTEVTTNIPDVDGLQITLILAYT